MHRCSRGLLVFLAVIFGASIASPAWARNTCAELVFNPDLLDFGQVPVGGSATKTVTVSNPSATETINVPSIFTKAPFAIASNNCPPSLAPGATCQLDISFTPPKPKKFNGKLSFVLEGCPKDSSKINEKLRLKGAGLKQTAGPSLKVCDPAVPITTSGSAPFVSKTGPNIYIGFDSAGGGSNFNIEGVFSWDNGKTWSQPMNISNDSTGNNFNPRVDYDSNGGWHFVWQHQDSNGQSVNYANVSSNGTVSTPISLGKGLSPSIAVGGSTVFATFADPTGVVKAVQSTNWSTFTPVSGVTSPSGSFQPLINASGPNISISFSQFKNNVQEIDVESSKDGGQTWNPIFPLHQAASSGDSFEDEFAFFLGIIDPVVVNVGFNEQGSSSGTLAFIAMRDFTGSGSTKTLTANNFAPAWAYSRTDNVIEMAGVNVSDGSTHLLQADPTKQNTFSDLTASTHHAEEVSIGGDNTNAFIAQTVGNSIPGPIEVIHCH